MTIYLLIIVLTGMPATMTWQEGHAFADQETVKTKLVLARQTMEEAKIACTRYQKDMAPLHVHVSCSIYPVDVESLSKITLK